MSSFRLLKTVKIILIYFLQKKKKLFLNRSRSSSPFLHLRTLIAFTVLPIQPLLDGGEQLEVILLGGGESLLHHQLPIQPIELPHINRVRPLFSLRLRGRPLHQREVCPLLRRQPQDRLPHQLILVPLHFLSPRPGETVVPRPHLELEVLAPIRSRHGFSLALSLTGNSLSDQGVWR